MTRKLTKGLVALMVLISGLGVIAAPGAAATYDDGDESIVVQVDWDDAEVSNGDLADLDVDGETVEVVVRHAGSTSDATYWVAYDDLDADPNDGDELAVSTAVDTDGTVTVDQSVGYIGAETINASDDEMIEAEILVDEDYGELPVDVDVAVYADDDSLNSTTLTELNGSEWDYHDFEPDLSEFEDNSTHVTVQIDHVEDDLDEQAFESVEEFDAVVVATTGGIFGDGDNDMLIIGAVVVVAGFVLLRD